MIPIGLQDNAGVQETLFYVYMWYAFLQRGLFLSFEKVNGQIICLTDNVAHSIKLRRLKAIYNNGSGNDVASAVQKKWRETFWREIKRVQKQHHKEMIFQFLDFKKLRKEHLLWSSTGSYYPLLDPATDYNMGTEISELNENNEFVNHWKEQKRKRNTPYRYINFNKIKIPQHRLLQTYLINANEGWPQDTSQYQAILKEDC